MTEEQKSFNDEEDWREEITEPKDTLKVADGEIIVFTFVDEGMKRSHPDFGDSIVFKVKPELSAEEKLWYVNNKNYNLLGQIKNIGALKGKKVEVTRKGAKKSDTRYTIKEIPEGQPIIG